MAAPEQMNLIALNNAAFKTTRAADDLNTSLMPKLGQRNRNVVARLAIARSLCAEGVAPPISIAEADEDGKVIKGHNLFGDDLATWVALVVEKDEMTTPTPKDIEEAVRRHWRRGIHLLEQEWKESKDSLDGFLMQLAGRAGLREGTGNLPGGGVVTELREAGPIVVKIGNLSTDVQTGEAVTWHLNRRGTSPHVAVLGTLGTGKTRTAMAMIRQIREQSGAPSIIFDMAKGDLAGDPDLVRALGAEVLRVPKMPVPLDVLRIGDQDELADAAIRFRESFACVMANRPGGAQLDALRDATVRALRGTRPVRITDVRDRLREVYSEKRRRDDTVISTFNDLTSWNLFEPSLSPADFFQRSWIIDAHEATETAQRLVVFLILDALYTYLKLLPDSDLDAQGNRALRMIVGIDEARRVLGYGQPSLVGLVRESRSKGGTIFLISQSPDDFDAEDDNFLENIGLGVCFRTNARSAMLNSILGQSVDLAGLQDGVCATRLVEKGLVRLRAME